jgi:hypothetical protein
MRPPASRAATALAVIAICAFAMVAGAAIARGGLSELGPALTDASFQRWTVDPALASFARDLVPADAGRAALADVLARRPLSSIAWLRLARAELAAGTPSAAVTRVFVMSVLTGPDEGYVMAQRALLGIALWEALSPDIRGHIAADLAGTFIPLTEAEKDAYRAALAGKTEAVRGEIRDALVAARLPPHALARIGL